MSAALNTFTFEGKAPVRTTTGEDGEPFWVAKDVAEALGYSWKTNLVYHIPEEWRGTNRISTPGGDQEMAVLSESGLFFFLSRSDKPAALPFQKWIAGEVLPAIRKTGRYEMPAPQPAMSVAAMLLQSAQILVNHEMQLTTLSGRVDAIETRSAQAQDALFALEPPTSAAENLTTRAKISRVVREYCFRTHVPHNTAWDALYRDFRDRYHIDLKVSAKNRNCTPMEYAAHQLYLDDIYALAWSMFR